MNDKDKEAFNKYICSHDQGILQHSGDTDIDVAERAWQAACEYKQKEVDEYKEAARSEAQLVNELQAENARLTECVEFYANQSNWVGWHRDVDCMPHDTELVKAVSDGFDIWLAGKRARQCLKELDEE